MPYQVRISYFGDFSGAIRQVCLYVVACLEQLVAFRNVWNHNVGNNYM